MAALARGPSDRGASRDEVVVEIGTRRRTRIRLLLDQQRVDVRLRARMIVRVRAALDEQPPVPDRLGGVTERLVNQGEVIELLAARDEEHVTFGELVPERLERA